MKDTEVLGLEFEGWPVPDKFLVEIGRITALWSVLETTLNLAIGQLAGFSVLTDPKETLK